jgi:hypothetical protein
MDASETRILEQNMAKLKQSHEEQVFAEFRNMEKERNPLKEEKIKREELNKEL